MHIDIVVLKVEVVPHLIHQDHLSLYNQKPYQKKKKISMKSAARSTEPQALEFWDFNKSQ